MSEKKSKPKKTSQKRKQKYCTFSAYPEEIAVWKGVAAGIDRSLSWWIRNELNKAAANLKNEEKP